MVFYSIDDIKPDMVLGEDILESSGKLLLKEGFILKETHIELLRSFQLRLCYLQEFFLKYKKDRNPNLRGKIRST